MKKINVVQLIASSCLLIASILNLVRQSGVKFPVVIEVFITAILLLGAVCYTISIINLVKSKKSKTEEKE